MSDVVSILASWVMTTMAVFFIVRLDERRMTPAQRDRAWPSTSRTSAVVLFGVFCLPIHFARTRRTTLGMLAGVGAAMIIVILASLADGGVGQEEVSEIAGLTIILTIIGAFTLLYVRFRH